MLLVTFLNILGASVGFISAAFFAFGAATMSPKDIYSTVVTRYDINQHWYESASKQRAEYMIGAALLFLAFILQLTANLVPKDVSPSFLMPLACAWSLCGTLVILLLLIALLFRHTVAESCIRKVREM